MNSNEQDAPPRPGLSIPVRRLVEGLWQQREDLGVVADELLAIFRRIGLTVPHDDKDKPSP